MKNAIKKLLNVLETGTDVEKIIADNTLCMMKHMAETNNDVMLKSYINDAINEHVKEAFIKEHGTEKINSWQFLAYQMGSRSIDAISAHFNRL